MTPDDGRPKRIPKKNRRESPAAPTSGLPLTLPRTRTSPTRPRRRQQTAAPRRTTRGGNRVRIDWGTPRAGRPVTRSWLGRLSSTVWTMPAWALSLVVHLVLLLALALLTVVVIEQEPEIVIATTIASEEPSLEEFTKIEWEPQEPLTETSLPTTAELPPQPPLAPTLGDLSDDLAMASLGRTAGAGTEIDLSREVGDTGGEGDLSQPVTFYGAESQGNRFVFLIDNSPNMNHEGRMLMALDQLWRAVHQMNAKQSFYVIFYSNRPYPLFFPDTTTEMIEATRRNKERLRHWLATVELCDSRPRGADAIKETLRLTREVGPSTVFFLTDGDYAVTVNRELEAAPLACPLNVIGLLPDPAKAHTQSFQRTAEKLSLFDEVARRHHGLFSGVPSASAFPAGTFQPRSKDAPGPVWGTYRTP
ncbi:MAG: vWA domain-containing protein [Planctomycetota bacterium]